MSSIKELFLDHAIWVDGYLNFNAFTSKCLKDWMEPLANSITSDGVISYLIESEKRFRASPLASTIASLETEGLLPLSILDKMQDALIFLRDYNVTNDNDPAHQMKFEEDTDGWSLGEGVSVWSTSLAIIALLDSHGNGIKKVAQYRKSILWLAKQCDIKQKGWAYQSTVNCSVNPIMTSLALRALALSLATSNKSAFNFNKDEKRQISSAIINGFEYLKETCVKKRGHQYWCFNKTPHCAATTWALLALYQISKIDETYSIECASFFNSVVKGALTFVLAKIPAKACKWEDEQIVYEAGAKYNKQKNYFSYSATLIPQLIQLGTSPFHPKIINQIKWLIHNPDDWKISGYDKSTICTFTYAMVLTVLVGWVKKVGTINSSYLLKNPSNFKEKVYLFLFGYCSSNTSPIQIILKNRIWMFILLLLTLTIIFILRNQINALICSLVNNLTQFWDKSSNDRHDILINVIAAFVYAGIVAVGVLIINIIKKYIGRNKLW